MDVIETGLPGLFENSKSEVKEEATKGNSPSKNSTQLAITPLPHKMRPKNTEDFEGMDDLLKKYPILFGESLPSLVLWGPPGCGKTTLAEIIALEKKKPFFKFNAVLGGLNDLRKVIEKGNQASKNQKAPWILFIDEIHRFNKTQQDALLPFVETGTLLSLERLLKALIHQLIKLS